MHIRKPRDIAPSEITPQRIYLRRREFMAGAAALGIAGMAPWRRAEAALQAAKSPLSTDEPATSLKDEIGRAHV